MNPLFSLLLSTALGAFALYKRALTPAGTLLAWAMCLCICYWGGLGAFLILAATFAGTIATDKVAGKRADPNKIRRKSGSRGAVRVFCNVGIATICMILFRMNGDFHFAVAYAAVMAESLADSVASKIGPLTKGQTLDLLTMKPVAQGLSGGVSLLGSGAALFGAAVIGVLSLMLDTATGSVLSVGTTGFTEPMLLNALAVTLIGFAGCQRNHMD